MANYDFSKIKKRGEETKEWLKNEMSLLRTGRATPAIIENLPVDYYGAKSPLKGLASITVEDARTLGVKPWSQDSVLQIQQAVNGAGIGLQAVPDKNFLRIVFPELTEERRKSLLKILSEKLEQAKIAMRRERDEAWRDIQKKEKDGEIPEDDKFRFKDELQKITDASNDAFSEMAAKKEKEILG
jgi:ribosome recycling factor